jgi:hypothetical protein
MIKLTSFLLNSVENIKLKTANIEANKLIFENILDFNIKEQIKIIEKPKRPTNLPF